MEIIFLIVTSVLISVSDAYIVDPGPTIRATKGAVPIQINV